MSVIVLPAVRGRAVNLYRYVTAGVVSSRTDTFSSAATVYFGRADGLLGGADDDIVRIPLSLVGLSPGDVISASGEVAYDAASDEVRFRLQARDSDGNQTGLADSPDISTPVGFTRLTVEGFTIPANTTHLLCGARVDSGTGTVQIRKAMINRGPTAAPHEWPKRGAWAPITHGQLVRDNEQFVQRYLSGASQITTFPSRRWLLQFATHILEGQELREWSLAMDQLSDLTNVFHFVPPEYTGPSTGYEGPLPVVNGAGQLGTSLDCDGVTPETDIVGPGDYVSFRVTTSTGQTNYELHRISSLCTSDESGKVTLEFTRPIRLAPANDAVVQIYSPIGQFRLAAPRAGQDIQLLRRASVSVEAEEAIWL